MEKMLWIWIILFVIFLAWFIFFYPEKKPRNEEADFPEDHPWTNWFFQEVKIEAEKEIEIPKEDKWILRAKNWVRTINEYDTHKQLAKQRQLDRVPRSPIKWYSNPTANDLLKQAKNASYQKNMDKELHS